MQDMLSIYRYRPSGILNAVFARYAAAVPTNVMKPISIKIITCVSVLVLGQPLLAEANEKVDYTPIPAVDCVINPYRVVDISSPVAGVIEQVFVERSQPVTSGQVIAQLEASVERANVDLAQYRASVESEIELGRVNINFDRLRKKRIQTLVEESNISRENADQIEREVQLSQWKLKQATELAEIRQLELRKAQVQLEQKSISSPFDGFVLDIFKYRGEYVEDQAIVRLAQLDPLVIEAIVPMENFGLIEPGMQAEIIPEILLKDRLRGEVIAVDRIGDTASNTFGVKLSIPNPENKIPAGLKCIAKFIEMPIEQIADESSAPLINEIDESRLAEFEPLNTTVTDDAIAASPAEESSSLLAVIGSANAATVPTDQALEIESSIDEKTLQAINQISLQIEQPAPTTIPPNRIQESEIQETVESIDEVIEQTTEESIDETIVQATEKSIDETIEQATEESIDGTTEQVTEEPIDEATELAIGLAIERTLAMLDNTSPTTTQSDAPLEIDNSTNLEAVQSIDPVPVQAEEPMSVKPSINVDSEVSMSIDQGDRQLIDRTPASTQETVSTTAPSTPDIETDSSGGSKTKNSIERSVVPAEIVKTKTTPNNPVSEVNKSVDQKPRKLAKPAPSPAGKPAQTNKILQAKTTRLPSSYMVVIELPKTRSEKKDLIKRLRRAGENEFLVYAKKGRISMGVYQNRTIAKKRRQKIERLGFTALILERYR